MNDPTREGDGRLTVVVPALNEAETLPGMLEELKATCGPRNWPIIVVDDGSVDETPEIARAAGVEVVRHKVRRGYGGALKSGIRAARTEWSATVDADGQHDPADVVTLLRVASEADADLVVGDRGRGASGTYRRIGKWLIGRLTRILMPNPIRDLNSGLKIYRTRLAASYLELCPDSMAFSNVITLVFLSKRHLVQEHPISIRPRGGGRSTISTQTAFETVMEILNLITLFNPMRIFLPLALAAWTAGLSWGIPIVMRGRGVSVGSMLAVVTGVVLFALGLLAEQLSAIRKSQARADDSA